MDLGFHNNNKNNSVRISEINQGIGMKLMEKMGYRVGAGLGKNEQGIVAPIEAKLRRKNAGVGYENGPMERIVEVDEDNNVVSKKQKVVDQGIGMKIMGKMGYMLGLGLGKNEQGIVFPIEAEVRLKNTGVGYENGHRERRNGEKFVKVESVEKRGRVRTRNRGGSVMAEEERARRVVESVIDMSGPHVRVVTNMEDLFDGNEYRECEEREYVARVRKRERECRDDEFRGLDLENLNVERDMLRKKAEREKKMIDDMEGIMKVLDMIEEEFMLGRLTLEFIENCLGELPRSVFKEYDKMYNLCGIVCNYGVPLLVSVFKGWDPLQDPSFGIDVISRWKSLLGGDGEDVVFEDPLSSYCQLVNKVVVPSVRSQSINTWQARDPEPMLRFLELWGDLLPSSVFQSLVDVIVMPKLSEAVKSYDPHTESDPIHVWIHPWLPVLGQELESLYPDIRAKFGNALRSRHSGDTSSAYEIISPWETVFDAVSWEKLIIKSIIPKLGNVLQEFQVNPTNQKLDQFLSVMDWVSIVPNHHMINLLETHFFNKWHQVLYQLLCSNPNFEEILQWYLGWKECIPAELLAEERIRYQLNVSLDMMNRAVEGLVVVQPSVREHITLSRAHEKSQFEAQMEDSGPDMSLKEVIEAYAQEHGLMFAPKPGILHNQPQVYSFGSVSITVDSRNQKLLAHVHGQWSVVSLAQLLQMQNLSSSRQR